MAKEKSTAKKVGSVIGNVFIWLFIVFAVVVTVIAFAAKTEDGVRSIGGKVVLTVQTPSMEPVYKAGDIIIGERLDVEARQTLQVGDIITFKTEQDINQNGLRDDLITHRITEVILDEEGKVEAYETKGDNNAMPDVNPVDWEYVVCQHTEKDRIPALGAALDFLNTPTGFLICVVIPLVLFFIFELISFIRKFLEVKNDGKKQISAADEEEIKQRAVAEYLKQQAEKEAAEEEADAAEEAKAEETAEEAPAEEAPAGEAPVEETPVEEAPVEETAVEETPVEANAEETKAEAPAEEAPADEAPAEADAEKKTEE